MNATSFPAVLVVMGVAGAGKTTVGRLLAERLDRRFLDADDFHTDASRTKLREGRALGDDEREPWLRALNDALHEAVGRGEAVVLACSALAERHRRALTEGLASTAFVYLRCTPELAKDRLSRRTHFFNPILADSQFAVLEEPVSAIVVEADRTAEEIVAVVETSLSGRAGQRGVACEP
jgi:gluconokinase